MKPVRHIGWRDPVSMPWRHWAWIPDCPLLVVNNSLTAVLTNMMADGPAAAAVGPISLNMAGLVHPGTTFLPFIAMSTAAASSFAYCLIIGTPPNAIVYASGYLEPKDFLRMGIIMWVWQMSSCWH